jgi:hypothetical protein
MADDDDICSNAFFVALQASNRALLSDAAVKGALVCVPKAGTCQVESMGQQDYKSHVLLQSPFFVGIYDSLNGRQVTCDFFRSKLCECTLAVAYVLAQVSVDGQTITTGKGYSDTRSVRIEREDIIYGCAPQPSTPLRLLLLSAPLSGRALEAAPESKVDVSGQALLLLAQTLVTGQIRSRCISKTDELRHSYVMVKTFEHLLGLKLHAIVTECAVMLQGAGGGGGSSKIPFEMQQASLRCFVESCVHAHVMHSLGKLWADEVARFAACCDAIKRSDLTLPLPPPASTVLHHVSGLNTACCYTQKVELLQRLLDAILLSAGAAAGGGGVISTDDLLPFIIAFVCAHACDGSLLLHVMFCDCMQHTLLAQGEWSFTLSLFKSAVVYVTANATGSGAAVASVARLAKGGTARKNSVTSLAAAVGGSSSGSSGGGGGGVSSSSSSISSVQQPQSVPPYRRSSLTRDASALPVDPFKIVGSSSMPPAVILAGAQREGAGDGAVPDRYGLGSFLSSLIDDD